MTAPLVIGFDVTFDEAIAAADARDVVLPEEYYGPLQAEARRIAFTVRGLASLDQLQTVLDQLTDLLNSGGTLRDFQAWAEEQNFSLPRHRAETVFRNAIQNAYNAGHWRQFEQNMERRPYLMYDAINDSRTSPVCRAIDGVIRRADDPFWQGHSPQLHHRCRSALVSLTEAQASARSRPAADGKPRGINIMPTPDMEPTDAGWGGRPDRDRDAALQSVIASRQPQVSTMLFDALQQLLGAGAATTD